MVGKGPSADPYYGNPFYLPILKLLGDGEPRTIKEIMASLRRREHRLTYNAVKKRIYRLLKAGLVVRVGKGTYALAPHLLANGPQRGVGVPTQISPLPAPPSPPGQKAKDQAMSKPGDLIPYRVGLSYAFLYVKRCRAAPRSFRVYLAEKTWLDVTIHKNKSAQIILKSTDNPLDFLQFERFLTAMQSLSASLGFDLDSVVAKQYEVTYDFERRLISCDLTFQAWTDELLVRVYAHKPDETRAEIRLQAVAVPYHQAVSFVQQILQGGASMLHLYQATYLALRNQNAMTDSFTLFSNLLVALVNRLDNLAAKLR